MLTIWGDKQRFCDGITRRSFLKIGAFGAGLSLADMLRLRAAADNAAPKPAKSVIMIWLPGGLSHMDSYDMKPDAPKEFRGEFKPIQTNVSGVQICEHFPRQAKMWDKLACIRSVVAGEDQHLDVEISTGYTSAVNRTAMHPSVGSVISKVRGTSGNVPPFVSYRGTSGGLDPGYLGNAHRAFSTIEAGMQDLVLPRGVNLKRVEDRKQLLASFDTLRRDLDASGAMQGMDSFNARAFDIVASGAVHKAIDLSREKPRMRERYKGFHQFLEAIRLVEAGVSCVTLALTFPGSWDTHGDNFRKLKPQLPELDRVIATLIEDLHERGLANDVITIVWGEFGRTPKINTDAGRDHYTPCFSALIAGGGLKMGQVIGSSNARGEYPKEQPYRVPQVLSTIYRQLGIDPSMTFPNGSGRPMYILDDREPVTELL